MATNAQNVASFLTGDVRNIADRWAEAKRELDAAKKAEMELRAMLVKLAFPDVGADETGTKRAAIGNDREVKAVFKLNYNLNPDATDEALTKIEEDSEEGKFLAERVVKWKPELAVGEFKKLPPKYKALIEKALTITPATPSVEIIDKSED